MTRKLIDLTSNASRLSPWARRMAGLSAIGLSVAGVACLYACSGDDNDGTTPVPLNDASTPTPGTDGSVITPGDDDSGIVTNPDGSTVLPGDSGPVDAGPAPACSTLPGKVVYIESGDTQEPLLKTLGRELRDQGITIVFQLTGSCTLTPNLYGNVAIPANTSMLYIPSTAENPTWSAPTSAESTCTTSAAVPPDLGISALFPSSCAGLAAPPATIGQWNGPTQAYTFIVPSAEFTNGQTSISADEAYYAFGDGTTNPVTFNGAPEWNVPAQFFLRPKTKSTLVSTAFNIHLTATQMTDVLVDGGTADGRQLLAGSSDVLNGVKGSTNAQAIGILGDEIYDANRGAGVNVLAFKAFGQTHAFYPDSTETAFDKQNIRDGHYTLWSPTVYIAPIAPDAGAGAEPSNATVKYIVDTILGNPGASSPDGGVPLDGLKAIATVGLTPACAMQVQRTGDGAPLTAYTPAAPCTCKFLHDITGGAPLPASCTTCTTSATCTGGLGCFNGFCETAPTPVTDAGTTCDATSIINACTNATSVDKAAVVFPTLADGGLQPVTQ